MAGCAAQAGGERLRGDYSYGHEVNVFCPAINSQCYWLGPNSSQGARAKLKQIYEDKKPGLYKPVCVVVEGTVDRDSERDGFAADYDGLIEIEAVLGSCDDGALVTPGDLNHRRWVLAEHDGIAVDAKPHPVVLDFGERLFVEGRDGCQRFSGFIALENDELVFDRLDFDSASCRAGDLAASHFAYHHRWRVSHAGENMVLQSADTRLVFERDDWR